MLWVRHICHKRELRIDGADAKAHRWATLLQGGRWKPKISCSGGNRRTLTFFEEEGYSVEIVRVVGIEIQERGSVGESSGMCSACEVNDPEARGRIAG